MGNLVVLFFILDDFVVKRFYLTLILYDLWKQRTLWEVAEKFEYPRGFVQNLLSGATSFATCVYHFCQELEEFWAYQELLGTFVKRLAYCVSAELLPLMEIPGVKLGRAKQLYNAGFQSVALVAAADPEILVKSIQQIPRKVAKQIVASAKVLLNEKAEALLQEVEELVTVPVDRSTVQSSQGQTSPWDDMDLFSSLDTQSSTS
ncbi:helicase POLQ-like [Saccostrea cucullata]|uniref:helicase POLQ-like n=1 Tax=Saccostrea cuccullata TaxID=36930 RepID=UPI002ED4D1AC